MKVPPRVVAREDDQAKVLSDRPEATVPTQEFPIDNFDEEGGSGIWRQRRRARRVRKRPNMRDRIVDTERDSEDESQDDNDKHSG